MHVFGILKIHTFVNIYTYVVAMEKKTVRGLVSLQSHNLITNQITAIIFYN